jgi:hypothetical protein
MKKAVFWIVACVVCCKFEDVSEVLAASNTRAVSINRFCVKHFTFTRSSFTFVYAVYIF